MISEEEVSCLKCCDFMCECKRTNKFMLEWHSTKEIREIIISTKSHIESIEKRLDVSVFVP